MYAGSGDEDAEDSAAPNHCWPTVHPSAIALAVHEEQLCARPRGGVKVFMINGQGRWRLHAQEPGDMVYKYWQSSLLEKIATSNF